MPRLALGAALRQRDKHDTKGFAQYVLRSGRVGLAGGGGGVKG